MKQIRLIAMCMMAMIMLNVSAKNDNERVLNSGQKMFFGMSEPVWDEALGDSIIEWGKTANKYRGDSAVVTVKDFDILEDITEIGCNVTEPMIATRNNASIISWKITEEPGKTVLHCYMMMPANVVKRMWLGGEETYIVDQETGIHYKPRSSKPNVWQKYFTVKAPKGTIVDFTITFPPLPKSVKKIAIYGVPNWRLNNARNTYELNRRDVSAKEDYDTIPHFHIPQMIQPEKNYDKNDAGSWAYYNNVHTIKPVKDSETFAIWRTPTKTYLAIPHDQTWTRQYWGIDDTVFLVDNNTGQRYKIMAVQGVPLNHLFWIRGCAGDRFALVLEFEPLPADVTSITYVEPDGEPFEAWGANWEGRTVRNLNIETLRQNQKLFEYFPRQIVE